VCVGCWVVLHLASLIVDGNAPASYSSGQKYSLDPIHELMYCFSMLLNIRFSYPTSILCREIFPLHQVLKISFPPSLLTNPLIYNFLHLWIFCCGHMILPLDLLLIIYPLYIIHPVRVQVCNIKYGWYSHILSQLNLIGICNKFSEDFTWSYFLHLQFVISSSWEPVFP